MNSKTRKEGVQERGPEPSGGGSHRGGARGICTPTPPSLPSLLELPLAEPNRSQRAQEEAALEALEERRGNHLGNHQEVDFYSLGLAF